MLPLPEGCVMLLELSADANRQPQRDPTERGGTQRRQWLMASVDRLNQEQGRNIVRLGATL